MAKRFLQRWLPKPHEIRNNQSLGILGEWLHDPNIWHLNRRSVSAAFFIGIFVAFMPTLGQMVIAAAAAIIFRSNLPVSVVLVWISNPITMAPIYYGCYRLGALIVGDPEVQINWAHGPAVFLDQLHHIIVPLLVGCTITGLFFATLGFFFVRLFWRLQVIRAWNKRRSNREQR